MTNITHAPAHCEAAVIGAGPAGMTAAAALALKGISTILLAAPHKPAGNRPDTRTAALFNGSLHLLDRIGAWSDCRPHSAPLGAIRIIDDTGGVFRAPEVLFQASEIGEDVFGYNVPQTALTAALRDTLVRNAEHLTIIETEGVTQIEINEHSATLTLAEGNIVQANLVAAADGRNSIGRRCAGIDTKGHGYEQAAITCTISHTIPHSGISTELHRKAGPCTVVPLPGNASSLVWVERPGVARRLYELDDKAFITTLSRQLRGLLGTLSDLSPRALFPLQAMTADTMAQNRTVLIGEAAHVMPPIGAQGLNLSFRDAATLAELAFEAKAAGRDIGGNDLLNAYTAKRGADVRTRGLMVDVLNRALTTDILPIQLARGLGLHAIRGISPLKSVLMKEGMQPTRGLPELMQPHSKRTHAPEPSS